MTTDSNNAKTEFPPLYHRDKAGRIREWLVWAKDTKVFTAYGVQGGLHQLASYEVTPKNIGRSNCTNSTEQAKKEAAALYQHKLDTKYSTSVAEAEVLDYSKPMLAHSFKDHSNKIVYPANVQPKLNGLRCRIKWNLYTKKLEMISRGNKPFKDTVLRHILMKIGTKLPANWILDGELYVHGSSLQKINSWVKKYHPGYSECVMYYVYDITVEDQPELTWSKRKHLLKAWFKEHNIKSILKYVPSTEVSNKKDVLRVQKEFVEQGYEGAILRNLKGQYKSGHRSFDLQKVKTYQDAEFRVTGYKAGVGKFAEAVIFECETKDGVPFDTTIKGSMAERKQMLKNAKKFVGRLLTVRYFELSDKGAPQQPVGLHFKEDFDLEE